MGQYWSTDSFKGKFRVNHEASDLVDFFLMDIQDISLDGATCILEDNYENIGRVVVKIVELYDEYTLPVQKRMLYFRDSDALGSFIQSIEGYFPENDPKSDRDLGRIEISLAILGELIAGNDCVMAVEY